MTKSEKWDDAFNVVAELNIINYLEPKKGPYFRLHQSIVCARNMKTNNKLETMIITTGEKMRSGLFVMCDDGRYLIKIYIK